MISAYSLDDKMQGNSIYFYIYSVYFIRVKCVDIVLLHNETMSLEKSHLIS